MADKSEDSVSHESEKARVQEINNLVKQRTVARGYCTRFGNKLIDLCKATDVQLPELEKAKSNFEEKVRKLEDLQDQIDRLLTMEEIEDELNSVMEYHDSKIDPVNSAALNEIAKLRKAEVAETLTSSSAASGATPEAKLPRIEFQKFSGGVKNWLEFWGLFKVTVEEQNLADITKFSYLKTLLEGEAKSVIAGLAVTAQNYKTACELLEKRFGGKEQIIFFHIQELLRVKCSPQPSLTELWNLYDDIMAHVRTLQYMGVTGDQYGVVLTPLIAACFPEDLRYDWAKKGKGKEADLDFLLEFLEEEIHTRERSQSYSANSGKGQLDATPAPASASALHTSASKPASDRCAVCDRGNHPTHKCYVLLKTPVEDRRDKLKNACWKCLTPLDRSTRHSPRFCKAKCSVCDGDHHSVLCPKNKTNKTNKHSNTKPKSSTKQSSALHTHSSSSNDSHTSCTNIALETLSVSVGGKRGVVKANLLFDSGSDKSYVSKKLIEKIGGEWVESLPLSVATFGTDEVSCTTSRDVYKFMLKGNNGHNVSLNATAIPTICPPISQPKIPDHLLAQMELEKADLISIPEGGQVSVDILIGMDAYWRLRTGKIKFLTQSLAAQKTLLGWVLSGCVPDSGSDNKHAPQASTHSLFCREVKPTVENWLWDLESIGVADSPEPETISQNLEKFQESVTYDGVRYSVALPWKEGGRDKVMHNKYSATKRFESLKTRLAKTPELEGKYHAVFAEMWANGIIEEVPENELATSDSNVVFYLPHRPVVKETSATTKIRPVFDASATAYNGVSLNDCVETGPNLLPDLVKVLLRFRRWKVALTADVVKAFLQVGIHPADRDVHRFIWDDQGVTRIMRFTRVPFGNKASPYLLCATIKHHLSTLPPSKMVEELSENLYMDDLLSGADTEGEACRMLTEAKDIMGKAGMELSKLSSNSDAVSHLFKNSTGSASEVLGIKWDPEEDVFSFEGIAVDDDLCLTKRVVLSLISRLFDPLGLITPFSVKAKTLFQTTWCEGLDWDQTLSGELANAFREWVRDLTLLKAWKIPRRYFDSLYSQNKCFTLHAFGDASEKAYGACVYILSENKETSLVMSRVRVAPLKNTSLPRLELLGALLCARLLVYVRDALKLTNVQTHCWTDSTIALAWIQSDSSKWKKFVANRVSEIQAITDKNTWHHCPGKDNPADLVTRGLSATELMESTLWRFGPVELMTNVNDSDMVCKTQEEAKGAVVQTLLCCTKEQKEKENMKGEVQNSPIFQLQRYSSFTKALRVVAYTMRFIGNLRAAKRGTPVKKGEIEYSELVEAKILLLKETQSCYYASEIAALRKGASVPRASHINKLSPFLGEDGLLRVQGRLQFAGLPEACQHPIILPKCPLSHLLATYCHYSRKHAGVNSMLISLREEYWIVGARQLCKKVRKRCVSCQRQDATPCAQPMAPLPADRIRKAPPFTITGLDHAGPLSCLDYPGKKFYILLFTCAVVRAVHLELVSSLSHQETVLAIRRFNARRGVPQSLWSDNAKGFWAASEKILASMGTNGPEWKNITPRAPWWGGWWERLVGSVKTALRRSIGKQSLSRTELETALHEVEACINSRPLTFVGDDLDSGRPLTPSHFLLGRTSPLSKNPDNIENCPNVSGLDLEEKLEFQKNLMSLFWEVWRDEYLKNLPPLTFKPGPQIKGVKSGDVVLIEGEGAKLNWPLGIIQTLHPGKDGIARAATVKTAKGVISRPVQKLRYLEITATDPENLLQSVENPPPFPVQSPSSSVVQNLPTLVHANNDTDCENKHESVQRTNEIPVVSTRSGRVSKKRDILDL